MEEVNKVERFSCRNNLRLIGVPESEDENVKAIVTDILTSKFKMENVEVERAHRDGKPRTYMYEGKPVPRHILSNFSDIRTKSTFVKTGGSHWKEKHYVLQMISQRQSL